MIWACMFGHQRCIQFLGEKATAIEWDSVYRLTLSIGNKKTAIFMEETHPMIGLPRSANQKFYEHIRNETLIHAAQLGTEVGARTVLDLGVSNHSDAFYAACEGTNSNIILLLWPFVSDSTASYGMELATRLQNFPIANLIHKLQAQKLSILAQRK